MKDFFGNQHPLGFGGRRAGIFYAGGLCYGGNRIYTGEKRGQYYYEKPDGFLHWHACILAGGLWPDVRRNKLFGGQYWRHCQRGNYGTSMLPNGIPFFRVFNFPNGLLRNSRHHCFGRNGRAHKFSSYCLYSFIISLFVYPISGHWVWGGGWLSQLGFHDFAGSAAVHMVGGVAALIGAKFLGPRIGKYGKNGEAKAIPGHSLTLGALGVFILWFCWFGFNGASTTAMEGSAAETAAKIFVTTNLAAAVSTCVVMAITWIRYRKPDVSMTLNGTLAGLVAITAGCDTVSPVSAAIIGALAGFVVVFGIEFIDQKLKIDDPVGAVGVHGLNGLLGTVLRRFVLRRKRHKRPRPFHRRRRFSAGRSAVGRGFHYCLGSRDDDHCICGD